MENQEQKEGSDLFQLYDLKVEVLSGEKPMVCDHQQGEHFFVIGENIVFPSKIRVLISLNRNFLESFFFPDFSRKDLFQTLDSLPDILIRMVQW